MLRSDKIMTNKYDFKTDLFVEASKLSLFLLTREVHILINSSKPICHNVLVIPSVHYNKILKHVLNEDLS